MKIGLVGEAPNDVQSIKNLFERFYKVEDDFEFIFLLNNINGSQLEQQKTKHFLSLEYRLKKPDIVIFIRDLDGLKNNSTQVTLRKQYFTDFNSVVNRNGILLLHIYEIEALILSDIESFKKLYKCKIEKDWIDNPSEIEEPKEFLRKNTKGYIESHNPEVFSVLNFEKLLDCDYFSLFIKRFNKLLSS